MGNIINKVIVIDSLESKDGRIKLKDQNGVLYSFFQFKSGTKEQTQAYAHLMSGNHNEEFRKGDTARIGYSEKEAVSRDGSPIVYRNIISMLPTNEEVETSAEVSRPVQSNDAFGKRLAIHGFVNGLLAAGETPEEIIPKLPTLVDLEEQIDIALVGGTNNEDIDVSKIPF